MRNVVARVSCVFEWAVTFASLPSTAAAALSYDFLIETSSSTLCDSIGPYYIGDSVCNSYNNNEDCDYDGGDCCECTCEGTLCGFLGFQCIDPSATCVTLEASAPTPAPTANAAGTSLRRSECDVYGGNGFCDLDLNDSACDFDKGDCCPCDCSDDDNYGNSYVQEYFDCGFNGWACATPNEQTCD